MKHDYLAQFSEDEGYLDFARVGPPSSAVVEAVSSALSSVAGAGPATVDRLMDAEGRAVRGAARLLGAAPGHVAYVPSTSDGLFQVAFALPGDRPRVLVSPAEFPANLYPWWRAEEAGRLEVGLLPAGPVTPDVVRAALQERDAAAVALSAVDFATGHRADLAGLREVVGERLLIADAIQAVGAVDEDWSAVDVLVTGGQKWLRSGWSTGVIAVSGRALERLHPLLSGWVGVEEPLTFDGRMHAFAPGAERFSNTNSSPVAQAGLAAGLELLQDASPAWVAGRIETRVGELLDVLERRGAVVTSERAPHRRAGIVSFAMPGVDGLTVHTTLAEAGVTCTRHGERVRLSVHATTTPAALGLVEEALTWIGGQDAAGRSSRGNLTASLSTAEGAT